jgi:membrane associated rhomboid family serine protease
LLGVEDDLYFPRVLIYFFGHFGIKHLILNSLFFGILGHYLENKFSSNLLVITFLTSSIVAGICFLIWQYVKPFGLVEIQTTSGASGGIFGLAGAIFITKSGKSIKPLSRISWFKIPSILIKLIILLFWIPQFYYLFINDGYSLYAYSTHVFGFITGIISIFVYRSLSTAPNKLVEIDRIFRKPLE